MRGRDFVIFVIFSLATGYWSPATDLWAMARMPKDYKKQLPRIVAAQPLTLQDCYRLALRWSQVIAIRKEDIEETQAGFYKAAGVALGDVNFVMTNFRQEPQGDRPIGLSPGGSDVGSSLNREVRRERKFVIRQPIFQGFRSLAALGAVGSLTKQKKEEKIRAEQLLYLDVVQAFYFIHAHKKNVENYEKIVKLYQERIEDLEARERIGRSRLSEVVTAKSRMKLQEAELAAARGELANSLHTMEFLTGISIELGDLQDDDLIKEVLEEIDAYLSEVPGRPDVQAAFQSMRAYWQGVIEAQSGLWPHINLENNYYEKREGFQSTIKWDLLFTIDVPLFKGGETVGSIKEAVSRWKKAKLSYSQITREAELEIERAYEDWVALVSTYKAYEEAAGAAQESFNLQKKEYDRNLISNLDVLVALESLFNIKRDAVRSYYEVKESYWRLKVASGDCCE